MSEDVYPWPHGHRGAAAISVDVDGPIPHLWKTRAGSQRVSEVEQRSYGPRRGLFRLLRIFNETGVTGTFYVPGLYAEQYPEVVTAIADAGHELGLHGWMHEPPTEMDRAELLDTIGRSMELLGELVGGTDKITGYRSPSWEMTAEAFSVLVDLGIRYDSSLMGDDRPYRFAGITEVPVSWVLDDAPYYRYVGGPKPGNPSRSPLDLAFHWCSEIDAAEAEGTLAVLTVHDWLSGRPAPAIALRQVLNHILARDLWCATVGEIASYHDDVYKSANVNKPLAKPSGLIEAVAEGRIVR